MLRIILLSLIVLGAILFSFFPTSGVILICVGAIGSMLASVVLDKKLYDQLNRDVFQLYYGNKVKSLFNQDSSMNTLVDSLDTCVSKILRKNSLDKKFINDASPEVNAAILLSLQKRKLSFELSRELVHLDFKDNARKAFEFQPYKKFLLSNSLNGLKLENDKILNTLLENSESAVGSDLKQVSDVEFINELKEASSDTLIVFSTTSQLSSDIIDVLINFPGHIKKIEFFVCSPLIKTNNAIVELKKEYSPHGFCLQGGQFITSKSEGSVDIEMDCTRRVFRILSSISRLKEFSRQQGIDVDINFFKQQYAGLKIKFLQDRGFLQIQPGSLTFANNTYRFGVTTRDSEICRQVHSSILELKKDTSSIETIKLDSLDTKFLEIKVIKELTTWLLESGVTVERIREYRNDFSLQITDINVKPWIDIIEYMLSGAKNYIQNFDFDISKGEDSLTETLDDSSGKGIYCRFAREERIHKTVALLIVKEDKVLLIEKSDPAYKSKFSIVAGHVNNKETINDALIREAKEEIGLEITNPDFLFQTKEVNETCRYGVDCHDWYVFHYSKYNETTELVTDPSEIKSFEWVKLTDLEDMKDRLTPGCKALFVSMGFIK